MRRLALIIFITLVSVLSAKGTENVFVTLNLSKDEVYDNEAFIATLIYYASCMPVDVTVVKEPEFSGFDCEEVNTGYSAPVARVVDGQRYITGVLRRWILTPQKTGKRSIKAGTYDFTLQRRIGSQRGYYYQWETENFHCITEEHSKSISVLKLPSKPKGFTGAVGIFDVDVQLSKKTLTVGQEAILTYRVSGIGNPSHINAPDIKAPKELGLTVGVTHSEVSINGRSVIGSSVTTFTINPNKAGKHEVTIPELMYFDPESKQYVTIPSRTIEVNASYGEVYEM